MTEKYTAEQLEAIEKKEVIKLLLANQEQMEMMLDAMNQLTEQLRIANQYRFGRHTEKLEAISGQLNLFDEADALYDEDVPEPDIEEIIPPTPRKKRPKGKRDLDLDGLDQEEILHSVSKETLDSFYGSGNWKKMPDDIYRKLRYEPASWTVEIHMVEVYVGTDGDHQDEFMRGERPKDLLQKSLLSPSLGAAIINGKYVNSLPLNRIEQEFGRNGINISRQDMSNWMINISKRYFVPFCERMKEELFKYHVNQADETPLQVINDGKSPGSKCWMWVHRSGEFYTDKPIVLYEFQKGRDHHFPLEYYKDFKGVLETDALQQYHLIEKKSPGIINANCWVHARRDYADAIKAMPKDNPEAMKQSIAYQALRRISTIFDLEGALKSLSPEERLKERQATIKPLVDEYFTWVKENVSKVLPKGKTADGLNYSINQEKYLRVFLDDGEVPIDNSASERAIRTFCIGKKNWLFCNTENGAESSALIYSVTETAKLNNLKPYAYLNHILTELPKLCDDDGNIELSKLDPLMPWSSELPEECRKLRR